MRRPSRKMDESPRQREPNMRHAILMILAPILIFSPIATAAQKTKTPPAAAASGTNAATSAEPVPVSATAPPPAMIFEDWAVRCQRVGESPANPRTCDIAQTVQVEGQGTIAQISLARPSKTEPYQLVVVVPSNVSFPSSMKIAIDDQTASGAELTWRRCLPAGCIADGIVGADVSSRWQAETGQGRITFKDAAGRDLAIPISFRGMRQALDALAKE
jgi:invasion protein IalB